MSPAKTNIQFPVIVEDKIMAATINGKKEHQEIISFDILFSDGYEDVFYWDPQNEKVFGQKPESAKYATALCDDLPQALELDAEKFNNIFQHEIDGALTNIWVSETGYEGGTIYTVAYNGSFRFALKRSNEQWVFAEQPQVLSNTDKKLAERVGYMLNSLL